jgi:hypothetical protein
MKHRKRHLQKHKWWIVVEAGPMALSTPNLDAWRSGNLSFPKSNHARRFSGSLTNQDHVSLGYKLRRSSAN